MESLTTAPAFFSRKSTFSRTLSERERTVVAELLDSQSRHATRMKIEAEAELVEGNVDDAKEETMKPTGEQRPAKMQKRKRAPKINFKDVADSRHSTHLTQMKLQSKSTPTAAWIQRLYGIVCCQLHVRPRQYVTEALTKPSLFLANKFSRSDEILSIAVSFTDCDSISSIIVTDNKLETKSIAYLCHAIWQNTKINALTLAGNELTDEGLSVVVELLTNTRHLLTVSLSDNRIRDAQGEMIADLLLNNTSIKHLDLSYNQLGDQAAKHIGPALSENDCVRHLNLNWNCFRSVGVRLLTLKLNENIALRELTLKMNGLGMEGAGYIAKYLAQNETLFSIDLSGNRISDFGFELLSKMVARNATLREIQLGNNTVTTAGIYTLLRAFHVNSESALRILNFEGLYIDKKCQSLIDEIKADKPHALYFEMQGTVANSTEHKKMEMIRGIIDHDSPLEILRFYVEQTGSRLVDIFNVLDAGKKNSITKDDLIRGLDKLNVLLTQEQVDVLFDELDYDKSGDIDFGELMAGDKEARKKLRQKGKFRAAAVNMNATPDFADF